MSLLIRSSWKRRCWKYY